MNHDGYNNSSVAAPARFHNEPEGMDVAGQQDGLSEYGSDFTPDEEEILIGLLLQAPLSPSTATTIPDLQLKDIEDDEAPRGAKVLRRLGHERRSYDVGPMQPGVQEKRRVTIQIDGDSSLPTDLESSSSRLIRAGSPSIEAPLDIKPSTPDLRSPIERFRTKPKKALSVTDLVSPSWCELQYWYTLTKHGRKRRTPAMKQGSAVHKRLEDQVHTTIAVDITSNEDAWGLRIWNVIQGLRTLRDTGMTRELEIWGTVDGLVVNGVIDELSYICPDRELEEADEAGKATKMVPLPEDQATITDFLGPATLENDGGGVLTSPRSLLKKTERIYLCDVKTRGVKSIPKGASFRPTLMQLMLYHRLLSDLATNKVDADVLFDRYNINSSNPFSDSFIAQIGSLNDPYDSSTPEPSTQDSMTTLLSHNSPRALWSLMISEFALTMPMGTKSLGSVLKAEYRDQTNGDILGIKTFLYDENLIGGYVEDEMRWWKGEREAQGVAVEEAYKCGVCEFAEECWWRKEKVEEQRVKMRERGRARSSV